MKKEKFKKYFSEERTIKFFNYFLNNDSKAIDLYKANIKISESFYPMLSILEVVLRNRICLAFEKIYGNKNWYEEIENEELKLKIVHASSKIINRKEILTAHKITAELTFGFWVSIFNSEFESLFWKELRVIFSQMPKNIRKRHTISKKLNRIRKFRNRVFHYEPIIWRIEELNNIKYDIYEILNWIDSDIKDFLTDIDESAKELLVIKQLM